MLHRLARADGREAVGAPALAAHAVMREEQTVRIIFVLDLEKPRIVAAAPESLAPRGREGIAFGEVEPTGGSSFRSSAIALSTAAACRRAIARSGS